jgi:hypothetical protein
MNPSPRSLSSVMVTSLLEERGWEMGRVESEDRLE